MDIKGVFRSKRIQIIFLLVGAVGGFLYWKFVGCTIGACAIKSVWYWTTLWGGAVGYLAGDFISDFINKPRREKGEEK